MRKNEITPEDFIPKKTDTKKVLEEMEQKMATGREQLDIEFQKDAVSDAAHEAIIKIVLARYDDYRRYKDKIDGLYEKNKDSHDIETVKAARDGLYKYVHVFLDALDRLNREAERTHKEKHRLEKENFRLKSQTQG